MSNNINTKKTITVYRSMLEFIQTNGINQVSSFLEEAACPEKIWANQLIMDKDFIESFFEKHKTIFDFLRTCDEKYIIDFFKKMYNNDFVNFLQFAKQDFKKGNINKCVLNAQLLENLNFDRLILCNDPRITSKKHKFRLRYRTDYDNSTEVLSKFFSDKSIFYNDNGLQQYDGYFKHEKREGNSINFGQEKPTWVVVAGIETAPYFCEAPFRYLYTSSLAFDKTNFPTQEELDTLSIPEEYKNHRRQRLEKVKYMSENDIVF